MAIWFWTATDTTTSTTHILDIYKSQFEIEKNISSDYTGAALWYADVDTEEILVDSTGNVIDVDGNDIGEQLVDWADITATYNELTGYITITRSASIPIVIERLTEGDYTTYASFAAGTSDITFFAMAGKYRIRRDWASNLEASNVVYLEIVRSEVKHTSEGEKLLVGRYGQLQVGKTPDDSGYNSNYDKSYILFGLVKLPFTVSGNAGDTTLTLTPDSTGYITQPNILAYLKYDENNTDYLNIVKIKDDIYFAKPEGGNYLILSTGLKEDITNERLYVVNQFKIFSDVYLASERNKVVFEDSQMTLEDWRGTVAICRSVYSNASKNFFFEAGPSIGTSIQLHINKSQSGTTFSRIMIGLDTTTYNHRPFILLETYGNAQIYITGEDSGAVSYVNITHPIKLDSASTSTDYPDGTLLVDSTTGDLKFKKGGVWKTVQLA